MALGTTDPRRPDLSGRAVTIDAMRNYTYRAHWSTASRDYEGVCLEFPLLSAHAATAAEAVAGIEHAVTDVLANYEKEDMEPPTSLTDRDYSGTFLVRTSPALHQRLMVESSEQRVSLNQWVVQKLADRKTTSSLDSWF